MQQNVQHNPILDSFDSSLVRLEYSERTRKFRTISQDRTNARETTAFTSYAPVSSNEFIEYDRAVAFIDYIKCKYTNSLPSADIVQTEYKLFTLLASYSIDQCSCPLIVQNAEKRKEKGKNKRFCNKHVDSNSTTSIPHTQNGVPIETPFSKNTPHPP